VTRREAPFRSSAVARGLLLCGIALLCTAPTPGDVGGCGAQARELDEGAFFATKVEIDCLRCTECDLSSAICTDACEGKSQAEEFPADCVPLEHDGRVCLRALLAASCNSYRDYVDDRSPEVPTECNFCPLERP
jgi:hypothetical protein